MRATEDQIVPSSPRVGLGQQGKEWTRDNYAELSAVLIHPRTSKRTLPTAGDLHVSVTWCRARRRRSAHVTHAGRHRQDRSGPPDDSRMASSCNDGSTSREDLAMSVRICGCVARTKSLQRKLQITCRILPFLRPRWRKARGKKRIRVMGHKFESRVVKVLCRTTTVQENFLDIYAFYPLSLSRCCASVRCCRSRRRHLLFSFTDASDIYFTHDPIDGKGAAVKIVESVMMIGL